MKLVSFVFLLILASLPDVASAQLSNVCSGTDCSACNLVELGNNLVGWLIGVVTVLFAVLMVIAGFGLVTSGGNPSALQSAKDRFVNAIIGFVIVLAAWLVVDTLMRGLIGNNGNIDGWGPWSEVQCWEQTATDVVPDQVEIQVDSTYAAPAQSCDVRDGSCQTLMDNCAGEAVLNDGGAGGASVECAVATGIAGETSGACDGSKMSTIPFLGGRVTVDNRAVSDLKAIDSDWRSRGGNSWYRVRSVGAYNCRKTVSGSRWSVHAYGLAVDINPAQNPYGSKLITDMPIEFRQMFLRRGWGWGGNWSSVKDAMHFSMASNEGGNIVITDR